MRLIIFSQAKKAVNYAESNSDDDDDDDEGGPIKTARSAKRRKVVSESEDDAFAEGVFSESDVVDEGNDEAVRADQEDC